VIATDYKVLRHGSADSLEREIKHLLEEGWQPHGSLHHSVAWAVGPNGGPNGRIMNELYVQAMVKTV